MGWKSAALQARAHVIIRRVKRTLVLVLALAGCAAAKPPAPPASAPAPHLSISVNTDPKTQNRVLVDLRIDGPLAAGAPYPFKPLHDVKQTEVTTERLGPTSVHTRYALEFAPALDAAEAIELKAAGEDLFALPDGEDRIPVDLTITTGGVITNAVSTFGIGSKTHFEARPRELRNGYYVAGDIGTAVFHAPDGNDFAAWIDYLAFDPRWVAAVTAVTRGAVDAWVGRTVSETTPPFGLIFVATKRDGAPVIVTPRARGLFVSVDRRAAWTAQARIVVAQALVQRYVGGFLWVGNRDDEPAGWFFSQGFSRAIAREVLFESGIIESAERVDEVNGLLAATTFATEPREVAQARGALVATALPHLQRFVRELLGDAATRKVDTIASDDFAQRLKAAGGDEPLAVDLFGPCWRLAKKQLVPFELGFTTSAGQDLVVESVKPKSRAEAAGVKVGDVVTKLDYRSGNASVPVTMTVKRGDRTITLTFSPAGIAKPGRVYERVAGIPDDRC